MGVDLYIRSITDAAKKRYGPLFDRAVAERNRYDRLAEKARFERYDGYLEIAKEYKRRAEQCQRRVDKWYHKMYPEEGYYRDSYNDTNFMRFAGLPGWSEWTDAEGNISVEMTYDIRARIAAFQMPSLEDFQDWYDRAWNISRDEGNTPADWWNYFDSKRTRALKFLDTAIALGEAIDCSY